MKRILRLINLVCLIAGIVSLILLLNVTAPNPTGRRYSSQMPLTTRQGDAQAIGLSAELILSRDLGLPRNEDVSERQCICGGSHLSSVPNECRVCFAYSPAVDTFRRPDFVGRNFIAESKNRLNLLYTHTDQIEQLQEYADAAKALGQPLYLYIRVNTLLAREFVQIVESTGGSVIRYFTVPGYADPVDSVARVLLLLSSGTMLTVTLAGRVRRLKIPRIVVSSPNSPRPPKQQDDPSSRAIRKTDAAEDFFQRRKERAQQIIDTEDTKDEF